MYKLSEAPAGERRLLNTEQAAAYMSVGKNAIAGIAEEAQALVRIGNRVLYDKQRLDAWIDQQCAIGGDRVQRILKEERNHDQ